MVFNIKIQNLEDLLKGRVNGRILDQKVTSLTAPGENFCSLMLKLDLEIENDGKKEILNAVAKCIQASEKVREMNMMSMETELGFYLDVVPIVEEFMKENGIDEELFCKIYGGRLDKDVANNSVLIMENLVNQGYKNEDRHVGCDLESSKLIVKKLAVFHAIFIGLKLKKPDVFESKVKRYLRPPGPPPHEKGPHGDKTQGFGKGPGDPDGKPRPPPGPLDNPTILKALEENEETVKFMPQLKEIAKMKPFDEKEGEKIPESWRTVTHNDFWLNNVMLNLSRNYVEQVKIVDFQMLQHGCFTKDLIFFLFTSVQNPVLRRNIEELLRQYYDELTGILKILNLDLPLSYEEYQNLLKQTAKNELNHALFFSNVVFGEKNLEHDLMSDENFDPFEFMSQMNAKDIGPLQKDKILTIVILAGKLNWI